MRPKLRNLYSAVISILGLILVVSGIVRLIISPLPLTFYLLLLLAVLAQITMTAFVEGTAGISVSSAVSLTTVSLYGPWAGAMVAAAAEIGLWLIRVVSKDVDVSNKKRSAELLGVNIGINSLAIIVAGLTFELLANQLQAVTIIGQLTPWLAGAIVGDQVNLWLLIIIIWLAHGTRPLRIWRENRWAIPMNVLVMSVGGGLLSLAVQQFDILGIAIFFLPILLSAYSFRLTVNNAKKQMAKLEVMVAERTQELADANKELEDLHKDKDAFLAVLTHDMRTPLTSIKGYSSILRDRELTREQQTQIAKTILRSEETLLEIVNNILDIEKLQSGTPILLERSSFDLALLVRTVAESVDSLSLEKNITLQHREVPQPVIITADEKKIQRVLLNLISNAIKYTPEGGKVSIDTRMKGHFAIVDVKDTGYGIPEDELPHIFDRFRRVKRHQNIAVGTGLGLAIVKSLVEAHNGEIEVCSEVDVGSTFTVKLPL